LWSTVVICGRLCAGSSGLGGLEELWNNLWMRSARLSPRTQVLLAAVCFGTTGTAQALGPDDATPLTVGAARLVVGGLALVLVARASRARQESADPAAAPPPRWSPLVVLATGVAVAAYQLTFFAGVERTGVAVGTVVALGSAPAFAGALDRIVNGQRLHAGWVRSTGLAVLGVALLVGAGSSADVDPVGVLLALGAGAGYASYTVGSKRLMVQGHPPEDVMAAGFGSAAVLLLPVLVLGDTAWLLTPGGVALALFLGLVPTALAYVLFGRGLRRLASGEVATLTLAEPLTATVLGVLVLGERPGALAVLGAALVLAGLVLLARSGREEEQAEVVPGG
jgi:DME family drug/metabolite transporter